MFLQPKNIRVQTLEHFARSADVLRLDTIHPVVSGNKWFKLQVYIEEAKTTGKTTLLTFGGAFSNHLVATAAAARLEGFSSIGIVRGEEPAQLSQTLQDALSFGMDLKFVSRQAYDGQEGLIQQYATDQTCIIPMGGYGSKGVAGAAKILGEAAPDRYSHILCAVGSGTMLAGLVLAAKDHQEVIGISSMKGNLSLQDEVNALLPSGKKDRFTLFHDFHFGGFARHKPELLSFMNSWYRLTGIPSDFVYTGKLFYAVEKLCAAGYFSPGSQLLIIHSGGLQGNRSLANGTLIF